MADDKKTYNAKPGKFLWEYSRKERTFFVALVVIPISAIFLSTLVPFKISSLFAKLAQGNFSAITGQDFLVLTLLAIGGVLGNRIGFGYLLSSQARALERLQNDALDNLLQKSSSFYANQMTGKLTTDVFSMNDALLQYQDTIVMQAIPFALTILGGLIVVFWHSVGMGIGLTLLTAVVLAGALRSSKKRRPLRFRRQEASRKLRGYFADIIINNMNVKVFAREDYERREHAKLNKKLTEYRLHDWRLVTIDGNNRVLTVTALQIIFILYTVTTIKHNPALLGAGIFAFTFTLSLSSKLFDISSIIRTFENALLNTAPMAEIMQLEPEVVDPSVPLPFVADQGAVELKHVTFWYDEGKGKQALFDDINLQIKPGEKIGLVGPSGGGKSTITKLLLRFMDIQDGEILIDGQNIAKSKQTDVRRAISYVPQEPLLFHRSLAENIAYGNLGAKQASIERAAKKAHAHDFIGKLPDGYDTLVGERGVKLSGGQRQRVAIARAMLKNAPLLILDEATSALDSEAESLIQEALWELMKGKTAVVVAHRLSTIQKMDRIIVLDQGKIVEQGSHKELIKKKSGLYAKLWKHQSGGFLQEN